jgi:hypothetical protein
VYRRLSVFRSGGAFSVVGLEFLLSLSSVLCPLSLYGFHLTPHPSPLTSVTLTSVALSSDL